MNLVEGLLTEIDRCEELIKLYKEIPTGAFGAQMIKQDITAAKKALGDGDTVEMLKCYQTLKECE